MRPQPGVPAQGRDVNGAAPPCRLCGKKKRRRSRIPHGAPSLVVCGEGATYSRVKVAKVGQHLGQLETLHHDGPLSIRQSGGSLGVTSRWRSGAEELVMFGRK